MTLTSKQSIEAKTPVAAAVTPAQPQQSNYGNTPPHKVLVTSEPKPLVARRLSLPDFIDVKPKNPNLSFYWANFKAGDGQRAQKLEYMGFEYAAPEDCVKVNPRYCKNGRVINGDVILMKIAKEDYEGALLFNHNEAVRRGGRTGLPRNYVSDAASEIQGSAQNKITFFRPGAKDLAGVEGLEEVSVK